MRRMITTKEINLIEELNKYLTISENGFQLTTPGEDGGIYYDYDDGLGLFSDSSVQITAEGNIQITAEDGELITSANSVSIFNRSDYGLNISYDTNDVILDAGQHLTLSFNGEGDGGTLTIDDEDSGLVYIQCNNDLVLMPSLPTSDPEVEGAL